MSGVYKDCTNCRFRKAVARIWNVHLKGEYDCPMWQECPEDKKKQEKQNDQMDA